ncbi:hypothetical protein ACIQMR_36375 [Streptomyces sp. NPDC091376]
MRLSIVEERELSHAPWMGHPAVMVTRLVQCGSRIPLVVAKVYRRRL